MRTFEYAVSQESAAGKIIKRETALNVELYTEYNLWKDMQKAELENDYHQAKIYRDELIRRGKLQPAYSLAG